MKLKLGSSSTDRLSIEASQDLDRSTTPAQAFWKLGGPHAGRRLRPSHLYLARAQCGRRSTNELLLFTMAFLFFHGGSDPT